VARALMTRDGTASLNLRAIAREMGMTPSALYRYLSSRDAILTALITDAYDAVGEAVEQAVTAVPADGSSTGILTAVHAFRRWALQHPQEYGLIYGTPVPGYEAPTEDTIEAAMRTNTVLLGQLAGAVEMGVIRLPPEESIPASLRGMLSEMSYLQQETRVEVRWPGGRSRCSSGSCCTARSTRRSSGTCHRWCSITRRTSSTTPCAGPWR